MPNQVIKLVAEVVRLLPPRLRRTAVALVAVSCFTSITSLLPIFLGGYLIASLSSGNLSATLRFLVELILSTLVFGAVNLIQAYVQTGFIERVAASFRHKILERILFAPIPDLEDWQSGQLLTRLINDVNVIASVIQSVALPLLYTASSFIFSILALLVVNPKLALTALLLVPLALIIPRLSLKKIAQLNQAAMRTRDRLNQLFMKVLPLDEILAAKTMVLEKWLQVKADSLSEEVIQARLNATAFGSIISGAQQLVSIVPVVVLTLSSVLLIHAHGLSFAYSIIALTLFARIYASASGLASLQVTVTTTNVSWERIDDILKLKQEVLYQKGVMLGHRLHLDQISIRRSENTILENISITIADGSSVAIIGKNGSGKTSLALAIAGVIPVASGVISLGGCRLGDCDIQEWRRSVTYVPSDSTFYGGTIRENLELVMAGCDEALLTKVCQAVGLDGFSDRLVSADNDNADVDDRNTLSRGERQRLALARAMLIGPRVLVLDEALSALDETSESALFVNVREVLPKVTIIWISHASRTWSRCEQVCTVADGKLHQESGSSVA